LEIPGDLPEGASLKRWISEPIASVIIPKKIFLTNKNGYPVLSKRHQELVRKLFKVWIIMNIIYIYIYNK